MCSPPKRALYILQTLTRQELDLITDLHDALILARIKRMSPQRLQRFDKFKPKNLRSYNILQLQWVNTEKWLVGTRLGHNPTEVEVVKDFAFNKNGLRFKAFYVLKYPQDVTRAA